MNSLWEYIQKNLTASDIGALPKKIGCQTDRHFKRLLNAPESIPEDTAKKLAKALKFDLADLVKLHRVGLSKFSGTELEALGLTIGEPAPEPLSDQQKARV